MPRASAHVPRAAPFEGRRPGTGPWRLSECPQSAPRRPARALARGGPEFARGGAFSLSQKGRCGMVIVETAKKRGQAEAEQT